jgi:hypothetical protein
MSLSLEQLARLSWPGASVLAEYGVGAGGSLQFRWRRPGTTLRHTWLPANEEGHSAPYYGGEAVNRVVGEDDFVKAAIKRPGRYTKPPGLRALIEYVCQLQGLDSKGLDAPGRARQTGP